MSRLIAISVLIVLILSGFFSFSFAQENLTITTYYPSPYGSYKDLAVSNQLYVGTIGDIFSPTGADHPGAITASGGVAGIYLVDQGLTSATLGHPWVSGQVFYWYNSGSQLKLNSGTSDIMSITAAGNVGIGPVPAATNALDVNGRVAIHTGGGVSKMACWRPDGITLGTCTNNSFATATSSCTCN